MTAAPPPPSPRPHRIATPSWLDARLVLGVVLVLAAVLIGAKVVSSADRTYPVVAATHPLATGTLLTADDVELAQVQLPNHGRGVYLTHLADAVGKRLVRNVSGGELVPLAAVARPSRLTTVTVPLASGAAPDLHKGQRIELWISTKSCASLVLLRDVTVQAVHADDGGAFTDGRGGQDVVLSVAPELADRVVQALALDDAALRAGVLIGARSGTANEPLPDLRACSAGPASR